MIVASTLDRVTALLPDPFGPRAVADTDPAELCELVANQRRRHVLRVLADGGPIAIGTLAERVAAREHECGVADVTHQQRKRVYVSLHQTHLPRLADAGLATRERDTVIPESGIDAALEVYRTASAVAGGESA